MQEGGGGTRFSEFYLCQIKKKRTMIKILKKIGELFLGLIFQQIYYSIKAIPPASRLACQGEATHTHFMVNILAAWSIVNLSLDIEQLIIPTFS